MYSFIATLLLLVCFSCADHKKQRVETASPQSFNPEARFPEDTIHTIDDDAASKNDDLIRIAISCGIAGYTDPDIMVLKKQDRSRNYDEVRAALFNGPEVQQLVSALMLEEYEATYKITLTQAEKEKIKTFGLAGKKFSLCYSCTFHYEGPVRELFRKKTSGDNKFMNARQLIKMGVLNEL
jgi:hypothetical protein